MDMEQQGIDTLRQRHQALVEAHPTLRIRDRAQRLGATEAELVAAGCGVTVLQLGGTAQQLFRDLGSLGTVMALSRNDHAVPSGTGSTRASRQTAPSGWCSGPTSTCACSSAAGAISTP
jgi:putative hemin transport protein